VVAVVNCTYVIKDAEWVMTSAACASASGVLGAKSVDCSKLVQVHPISPIDPPAVVLAQQGQRAHHVGLDGGHGVRPLFQRVGSGGAFGSHGF